MGIAELIELEKELIKKEYELKILEFEKLIEEKESAGMEWLKIYLGIKTEETIKKNILYPYKSELYPNIVDFPSKRGEPWHVNKEMFREWYKDNFGRVDRRGSSS